MNMLFQFKSMFAVLAAPIATAAIFTQNWSFPSAGDVFSSPAVDEAGNLYFGCRDNRLYAVSAAGQSLWTTPAYGDWFDGSPALMPDGGVVVGNWDFSVYCFEQATGELRWSYATGGAVIASPAVGMTGVVHVASADGTVVALDPTLGTVRWTYVTDSQGDIETSLAVDSENNIYFADSTGTAISLDRNGDLRWAISLVSYTTFSGLTDFEVFGSPALSGDGDVYFGTRSQELFALDTIDGSMQWVYTFDQWVDSAPVTLSDGTILTVSRDGDLTRLSEAGFEIWTRDVGEVLYSAPAVDDEDRIFVAGYVGGGQTRFSCLDVDGNVLESVVLDGINDSAPNIALDGTVYFGMNGNQLIAFEGAGSRLSRTSIWPRFRQGMNQEGRYSGFNPVTMSYFPSAVTTDGEWYKLDWLGTGWLNATYYPWVYHVEHEWLYCSGEGNTDNYWFYDLLLGWVYTSRNWVDTFYNQNTNSWMFYLVESSLLNTEGRWFYDFGTGAWAQEQALYIK